jgi:hypothetical protein
MEGFNEFVQKLHRVKELGWVKTHRRGNTGIGKTFEDLMDIHENNIPGPNAMGWLELKSTRKNASSMITLFTKSPLPYGVNTELRERYGYVTNDSMGKKILHTTINARCFNKLRGGKGFKIDTSSERLNLVDSGNVVVGYWDRMTLKNCFEKKLPNLLLVKASCRGCDFNEEFYFDEAWALANFGFDNFVDLVERGHILIDIRLGLYEDGRYHDHGTGFRTFEDRLDMCYEKRKRVL